MGKSIWISAQPLDRKRCTFVADRTVMPGGLFRFATRSEAQESPLAAKLFDLPRVNAVWITDNEVTVTKDGDEEWEELEDRAIELIREHLSAKAGCDTDTVGDDRVFSFSPAMEAAILAQPPVSDAGAVGEDRSPLPLPATDLRSRVQYVLDSQINPAIAAHGGFAALIEVKDDTVYVQLGGGCQGCGMADVTLKQGIEAIVKGAIPEVREVLDVTDHAGGRNPYYAPSRK
ncbi:MAG: NifU family protein [Planctomycetes bacterium]|nr:NifU family protein [Planctomycetota bacterium]